MCSYYDKGNIHINLLLCEQGLAVICTVILLFTGLWGPTLCVIVLSLWSTKNAIIVRCILIIAISLNAAAYVGFLTNHVDLSPNFCGTLVGMSYTGANIAGIIAPLSVGWIVKDAVSSFFLCFLNSSFS